MLYAIKSGKSGRLLRIDSSSETYTEDYYDGDGEPPVYSRDHLQLTDNQYAGPVYVTFRKVEAEELIKKGETGYEGDIRINEGWVKGLKESCVLVEIPVPEGIVLPEEVD